MTQSEKNNFLIDGFPRNQDNLQGWTKQMGDKVVNSVEYLENLITKYVQVNLQCVLFFNCTQDICTARCLGRGAAGSGR